MQHADMEPDDHYLTTPPWDIGHPQPSFRALADAGALRGRVLDAGCGTGEHALMAASLGLDATGVDLAANALRRAAQKALERGLTARFLRQDARRLAEAGVSYDTVLDCGLFHLLAEPDRSQYVHSLRSVLPPGGRYFMLGFSEREPGDWGPRRLTRDDITAAFERGWRIDSLEPATLEINIDPHDVHAWLLQATRTMPRWPQTPVASGAVGGWRTRR
ncbi:MAG: class I SAM-dependent methyltransferase [Chloroflexi bacterium]|nr:class I SAM-dependent methyltransferase [Chloroflexota bacterium]